MSSSKISNATYAKRRAQGLCANCQQPSMAFRCHDCKSILNDRVNAMRASRRAAGLCPGCGCGNCVCTRRSCKPKRSQRKRETITWISIDDELPDEGITVLIAMSVECSTCHDVDLGFLEDGKWSACGNDPACHDLPVTHWAEMPAGPSPN